MVTQPTEGDFKAFTAVCTHQGCLVEPAATASIPCPCHGSRFSLEDGSPLGRPGRRAALAAVEITVDGRLDHPGLTGAVDGAVGGRP